MLYSKWSKLKIEKKENKKETSFLILKSLVWCYGHLSLARGFSHFEHPFFSNLPARNRIELAFSDIYTRTKAKDTMLARASTLWHRIDMMWHEIIHNTYIRKGVLGAQSPFLISKYQKIQSAVSRAMIIWCPILNFEICKISLMIWNYNNNNSYIDAFLKMQKQQRGNTHIFLICPLI